VLKFFYFVLGIRAVRRNRVRPIQAFSAALLGGITVLAVAGETDALAPHGLAGESLLAPRAAGGLNPEMALVTRRRETDLAGLFGDAARKWGSDRFSVPLSQEEQYLDARRAQYLNALAIEWQHSLNDANRLTLSAHYGDRVYSDPELPGASGTAAAFAWSRRLGGESRLTGRLYMGDEDNRDRSLGYGTRRYYGLELVGRYALWRDHAPFASLAWQRSDYNALENGVPAPVNSLRHDSVSRLAAGWSWQILSNWDLRAEANYRFMEDSTELLDSDRTQLHFSTRYGFR
jgi:hypothetical protein